MNFYGSHQRRNQREVFQTPATEALHHSRRGVLIEDWETEGVAAPRPHFWRRPNVRRAVLVVLVVFLILVGWSIGSALTAPGTDSTAVRLAEWGRDHGFSRVITWLEKQQYALNQHAVGGAPVDQGGVVAAFNAGFRLNASHGGYYSEGHMVVPLQAVRVVRGMELDINPVWVSGVYFHYQLDGAPPRGFRLYPNQKVPPNHYLSPSSRDWFGWYARP